MTDAEYPAELEHWVERLTELEWIRSRARAREPGDVLSPRLVTDFVLIALSSGIIGNVGYDLIKAALRLWRRPKVRLPEHARDMHDAVLLAVLATHARCVQVDLPVPALGDLEANECERLPDRWRVELRRVDRSGYVHGGQTWPEGVALGATVIIPDGPLADRDIEVKVVAERDIEAAEKAERQRIRAIVERYRRPESGS